MQTQTSIPRTFRATLLAVLTLGCTATAQDTFHFCNYLVENGTTKLYSPIFMPELADPTLELHGNPSFGVPAGTTVYTGGFVYGTGFTAELWYGPQGSTEDQLLLVARTTFNPIASGPGAGSVVPVVGIIPNIQPFSTLSMQMRVYENRQGSIASWEQAIADPGVMRGTSEIYLSPHPTGFAPRAGVRFDSMELRGFNLHVVPEPSVLALAIIGGAGLLLLRRRR